MKPAIDIQHAFVVPDARRKGHMTGFITTLIHWFVTQEKIPLSAIYMTKEMVENNVDFVKFWEDYFCGADGVEDIISNNRIMGVRL